MSDEIECPDCEGWGTVRIAIDDGDTCPACNGTGWRAMTENEMDAEAERRAEDAMSEPPVSAQERYEASVREREELRR